ncbi:MAG: hypothetical protein RIB93_12195 [Coleofasciculus sp. D1-CHI-01]|uniref:hypothetical protein n=1 Tax=Coleofasciculus sp. D1-CHI-01 TaxID=3068482 RepID=UPI0032F78088
MQNAERYLFTVADSTFGAASLRPYLPITLTYQGKSITSSGLLDTGAAVNVLPHELGIELGAVWEQATTPLQLTGNLAQFEARVLIMSAVVAQFNPVQLVFAWTQASGIPLLLGQANFFLEFDVCFYRSQSAFEIRPKDSSA